MNRDTLLLVAALTLLALPACPGSGDSPADAVQGTDAPDAVDPGPAGCLGETPLARLSGVPHDTGAGSFCQESPWVSPHDGVRLPDGGWLVFGEVGLCCTDEMRSALARLDPAGALITSEHWEYNGMSLQGAIPQSLWAFGPGGVLVVKNYPGTHGSEAAPLSLEAVAPDLSRTWRLSADDLGNPFRLARLARPGSPDLHVLATGAPATGAAAQTTLLRITAAGLVAERHVLPSALPAREPLPGTGRWWTAGTVQEPDDNDAIVRFVAIEVGWDGVEGPRVEVGPFRWNKMANGWVNVWALDPAPEGYLVWAAIPGPKPDPAIQNQAWRVPLDGRAPWQVPNGVPTVDGFDVETPLHATVRADGAVLALANTADAQFRWRPMRVVFPGAGGAPMLDGPAFQDDFAGGREWRLDGWWDLADGSLIQARVLKAGAVKPSPSEWPSDGIDTVIVRLGADGSVRWTRDYGGGISWTPPGTPLWSVSLPGTSTPWDCTQFGPSAAPPDLLFFDGVCD